MTTAQSDPERNRDRIPPKVCSLRREDTREILAVYNQTCAEVTGKGRLSMEQFEKRFLKPTPPLRPSLSHSVKAVMGKGKGRGRIVGFSLVWVSRTRGGRRVASIRCFGVLKEFRRLGIGKLMLRTQRDRLFRKDFTSISLPGIDGTNTAGLRTAEALGAEVRGATTSWEIDLAQGPAAPGRRLDPDITLREPGDIDAEQLYERFCEFFADTSVGMTLPYFKEAWWRNRVSTLAWRHNEVVGMALVDDVSPGYIAYVGVSRPLRKMGVGTHMVAQTLSKMKTIGAVAARTTTTQDNQGMTRILGRLGFKRTGMTYHMTIKRAKSG